MEAGNDREYFEAVRDLYLKDSGNLLLKNNFRLSRGPYELVAVIDESVSDEAYKMEGRLIDLYDPDLPVLTSKEIRPGEQGYFYNLDKAPKAPSILASAGRVYDSERKGKSFSWIAKGPAETVNKTRVLLPRMPKSVIVDGEEKFDPALWDEVGSTYLTVHGNCPDGVKIKITW